MSDLGVKHDQDKTRYDLVDPTFEQALAQVMTYGANKYGDRNWEKGIKVSRLYAAARRHLAGHMLGNDLDEESSLPHLAHAAACLMMIHGMRGTEFDDRGDV